MIKKLVTALYEDNNILYFNEVSGEAIFSCNEMSILSIVLNNINLDDTNYGEDDSGTVIHIKKLNLKNAKHLKNTKIFRR